MSCPVPYYQRDGITLYRADCREVLPKFPAATFDMVVTDPPYLVSYRGRWGDGDEEIAGDSDPSWVSPVFTEVSRVLKDHSLCFSFYGWPHADLFVSTWRSLGLRPVSAFVFLKDRIGFGRFSRSQHELAYLLAKGRPPKPEVATSDVLRWQRTEPSLHPNEKPLGAMGKIIGTYTAENSTILDPFAGSGTTLVAARRLGRRAIGIEIDERHCETAALRLQQNMLSYSPPAGASQLSMLDGGPPLDELSSRKSRRASSRRALG